MQRLHVTQPTLSFACGWTLAVIARLRRVFRALASPRLTLPLVAGIGGVLAWATILESSYGRELACWRVYSRSWFTGLLGLLAANIAATIFTRLPWRKHEAGWILTNVGLLLLLAGAMQSSRGGIQGQVALGAGESRDVLRRTDRSQITVERSTVQGRVSTAFKFSPGPVAWRAGQEVEFSPAHALGLTVTKFYRHAEPRETWVATEHDYEGPALQIRLLASGGDVVGEDWLSASIYGGEVVIGPTMHVLLPIPTETMAEDFLHPPSESLGEAGVLSVHYDGQSYRVPVDTQLGREFPLGSTGIRVEIVSYLPDARPARDGSFESRSSRPRNPVLELAVYLPDDDRPMRQLAFAKRPLLNLDAAYGRPCPVKFWYHHPQVTFAPGVHFVQTPAGKLYCRAVVAGAFTEPRQVEEGSTIALGRTYVLELVQHLRRARQQIDFVPQQPVPTVGAAEAAVQVEVRCNTQRKSLWLRRVDERYGYQSLLTPQGVVTLAFDYEELPLGCKVVLEDCIHRPDPSSVGDERTTCRLRLEDPNGAGHRIETLAINEPLVCGKFTLIPVRYDKRRDGTQAVVLTATYDPGLPVKLAGCLAVVVGVFMMFFVRAGLFRSLRVPYRHASRPMVSTPTTSDRSAAVAGPAIPPAHISARRSAKTGKRSP